MFLLLLLEAEDGVLITTSSKPPFKADRHLAMYLMNHQCIINHCTSAMRKFLKTS